MFTRYDALKKYIYLLEKRQHGLEHDLESNERVSLLQDVDQSDNDSIFIPLLDRELSKITTFYDSQQKELLFEISELEKHVQEREEAGLSGGEYYLDDDDEDDDEDDDNDTELQGISREPTQSPKRTRRKSTSAYDSRRHRGLSFSLVTLVPLPSVLTMVEKLRGVLP